NREELLRKTVRSPTREKTSSAPPRIELSRHPTRDRVRAGALAQVGKHEGPLAAHPPAVLVHDLQGCAHRRRQIGLVDNQQVRLRNPRTTLAGNLVPRR